jgi:hypothetical protein
VLNYGAKSEWVRNIEAAGSAVVVCSEAFRVTTGG